MAKPCSVLHSVGEENLVQSPSKDDTEDDVDQKIRWAVQNDALHDFCKSSTHRRVHAAKEGVPKRMLQQLCHAVGKFPGKPHQNRQTVQHRLHHVFFFWFYVFQKMNGSPVFTKWTSESKTAKNQQDRASKPEQHGTVSTKP